MKAVLDALNDLIFETACWHRSLLFDEPSDVDRHDDQITIVVKRLEALRQIRQTLEDLQ
jgi:hypothetical protein